MKTCFLTGLFAVLVFVSASYALAGQPSHQEVTLVLFDKATNTYVVHFKQGEPLTKLNQREVHLKLDATVTEDQVLFYLGGHDGKKVTIVFPTVQKLKDVLREFDSR